MRPLLHVAHRHGGADRGRGGGIVVGRRVAIGLLRGGGLRLLRRSRLLHAGAHEDHLFDRGLLDVRGEGVRRNHLVAGTSDEVRLFQNAFLTIGLLRGGGLRLLRRSRLLHAGAHEDHLFDRGLLDVRGEGVRRNHLVAGTSDEVRLFQNAFLTLGLHLLGALWQVGGLLFHRVEWDLRLLGLHLGACARDLDRRRFVDRRTQRTQVGLHGVARFERDVAGVEHGLHVGEVGAQHGAGLAVDRDVDVRGLTVQCLTGIATGGGVGIGHGIRGRLRCCLRLRVGVRVLPLIETLTYVASPSNASRALPREAAWESDTEYAVGCGAASGFASA